MRFIDPFRPAICAFLVAFLTLPAVAQTPARPAGSGPDGAPPTLEERRQISRDRAIRSGVTRCRAVSQRVSALKNRPCADDDFLDTRRNLCLPRKNRYPAYLRWDPAAGRCRPRDVYEQGSCAGQKGRYAPGRRHAHAAVASFRMYGAATKRAEAALSRCEGRLNGLREAAAERYRIAAQNCAISKRLNRRDLVALHCK